MFRGKQNKKGPTSKRLTSNKKKRNGIFKRRNNQFPQRPYGMNAITISNVHDDDDQEEYNKQQKEQMEKEFGIKYKYISDISTCAFGKVVKVIKKKDKKQKEKDDEKKEEFYAIKIIDNIFTSLAKTKRILREIRILRLLSSHESIVELIDLIPPSNPLKFTKLSVVFEFMSTNLKQIFRSKQYFSNLHIEYILYQILLGLKFIHSAGIIHCNLKPQNIIINEECTIRICDFGLACGVHKNILPIDTTNIIENNNWYKAPESEILYATDIWNIGCIFGELLQMHHKNCLDYKNRKVLFNLIGTPQFDEIYLNLKDLTKIFSSTKQYGIKLLSHMLKFDVNKRITAQNALNSSYFDDVRDENAQQRHLKIEKFEFEHIDIDEMTLRALILDEIMYFNPHWKKQIKQHYKCKRKELKKLHVNNIGLSVGGSKDVNNFRECIKHNIIPSEKSISYNGLFYEYYFDTYSQKHSNKIDEIKDDGSMLFYPSYCYAKVQNKLNNKYEYYMTVGLNSNIKQYDFKRKHLNLVIVLDRSGSMSLSFDSDLYVSKMKVANDSVISLLKHLTDKDRFGMVVFNNKPNVMQNMTYVKNINIDLLKGKILSIKGNGGTNLVDSFTAAIQLYKKFLNDINTMGYDNRIIFLTDAKPNNGITDAKSLLGMVSKYANNGLDNVFKIYTTFIGIGLDFNCELIEEIASTRGCNYYSVKCKKAFNDRMDKEFEFMVTPLVFNVCLKLKCEGNVCKIECVYGVSNDKENEMIKNGEIMNINTLFASKCDEESGEIKGGIQLILVDANNINGNDNMNIELEVTFEDRNGNKYKNIQNVVFKSPDMKCEMNDMIENNENVNNFYDNTGIRKAIFLCKYVNLMKKWMIKNKERKGESILKMHKDLKNEFVKFIQHGKKEMIKCNDNSLQKEIDVMQKLCNI